MATEPVLSPQGQTELVWNFFPTPLRALRYQCFLTGLEKGAGGGKRDHNQIACHRGKTFQEAEGSSKSKSQIHR